MKLISILVPCFNEEDNVVQMASAIKMQMATLPQYDYEMIFIDNCSQDNTRRLIRQMCAEDSHVKAIFNAKNYGQFSSPYYGMLQANGDCVILMVCDFQDPVELIPRYLEEWENGHAIVLGQKTVSNEKALTQAGRRFYYRFMRKHSDIDFLEQVTGSGLYDRSFLEVMRKIDDSRPFLRGIVAEMGYDIKLVPFEQPLRKAGKSSNNFYRYLDAAAQSLTSYTKFGCRLALGCGVIATISSLVALVGMFVFKLLNWSTFQIENYILDLIIVLLCSLNIFFIGVVGEYVMDANIHVRKRPLVVESERINF